MKIYLTPSILAAAILLSIHWPIQLAGAREKDSPGQMATPPQLVVQLGHTGGITAVAFSPDDRLLLTGGKDRTVRLWEINSARELRRFDGHTGRILSVAFSPSGDRTLTTSEDQTVRLWELASGRELLRFSGHAGKVTTAIFSPDGKRVLIAGFDRTVRLWDSSNGKELKKPAGYPVEVNGAAFSRDGRLLLMGDSNGMIFVLDAKKWQVLKVSRTDPLPVASVELSNDGTVALLVKKAREQASTSFLLPSASSESASDTLVVCEIGSRPAIQRKNLSFGVIVRSAIASGSRTAVTVNQAGGIRMWDLSAGKALWSRKSPVSTVNAAAFSSNLQMVALADNQDNLVVCDLSANIELRRLAGQVDPLTSAAFTSDGRLWISSEDGLLRSWGLKDGFARLRLTGHAASINSIAFSANGETAITGSGDGTARVWETSSGKELRRFSGHDLSVSSVALSADESEAFTGGLDDTARLWSVESGDEAQKIAGGSIQIEAVALSADGRLALTAGRDRTASLWDVRTGRRLARLEGHGGLVTAVAFSPDSRWMLTASEDKTARLWETDGGKMLRQFAGHSDYVLAAAFSPDGNYVLTGGRDNTARLWDARTGASLLIFNSHSDRVVSVGFSSDGRFALTGSKDNTARLWDVASGKELCRIVSFRDGNWAVVTPDGRFDTGNLDDISGLHWVISDDPFRPLPLEIFMRDYYEPRLLARLLAGEVLPPAPALSQLNRLQPLIQIAEIKPQFNASGEATETVAVSVRVENTVQPGVRGGKQAAVESGFFDLRLFRDGQLVGQVPGSLPHQVMTDSSQPPRAIKATFRDIKLPRRADLKQIEFTAHAFNSDRVKSETARKAYALPAPLPDVKGRAYLINIGVNAHENPAFDLRFAANDARRLQTVLSERLVATGDYEEVVPIALISDHEPAGETTGGGTPGPRHATKENIRIVLNILAGKKYSSIERTGIPNIGKLRQARPEDLFLISFAGHGYADEAGRFYFVTYHTGGGSKRELTPELLAGSVSSDELSLWLREIDAGEMVMIVDACQSAAAVAGQGFKPGPMGSRGLGQMAYDKGMRVLSATQADNVALENKTIRQGLLTYALTRDALELGRADFKPNDGTITLLEWLSYGAERVPRLYVEIKSGGFSESSRNPLDDTRVIILPEQGGLENETNGAPPRLLLQGKPVKPAGEASTAEDQIQRPALFNFARGNREVTLSTQRVGTNTKQQ